MNKISVNTNYRHKHYKKTSQFNLDEVIYLVDPFNSDIKRYGKITALRQNSLLVHWLGHKSDRDEAFSLEFAVKFFIRPKLYQE